MYILTNKFRVVFGVLRIKDNGRSMSLIKMKRFIFLSTPLTSSFTLSFLDSVKKTE